MKPVRNEKGIALLYVILVMTVGVILVAGMMTVSLSETKQTVYQTNEMKAYYIARAGAESMVYRMTTIDTAYWDDFDTEQTTAPVSFGGGTAAVSVKNTGSEFRVVSTGTYRGVDQKVTAVLNFNQHTKLDYALYSKSPMVDLQMKNLEGNIASGGTIDFKTPSYNSQFRDQAVENVPLNLVHRDNDFSEIESYLSTTPAEINSSETTSVSSQFETVNSNSWTIDTSNADFEKVTGADGTVKMVYSGTPSSDAWTIIELKDESELKGLNVTGAHNLMLIVDDKLTIDGSITLSGPGKVEIHVMDKSDPDDDLIIEKNSAAVGNASSIDRLITYLTDGSQMNLDTNGSYYGYVIGPGATVSMKNGNTDFYGALYTNVVTVDANPSIYYVVPDDSELIDLQSIQFAYWE